MIFLFFIISLCSIFSSCHSIVFYFFLSVTLHSSPKASPFYFPFHFLSPWTVPKKFPFSVLCLFCQNIKLSKSNHRHISLPEHDSQSLKAEQVPRKRNESGRFISNRSTKLWDVALTSLKKENKNIKTKFCQRRPQLHAGISHRP